MSFNSSKSLFDLIRDFARKVRVERARDQIRRLSLQFSRAKSRGEEKEKRKGEKKKDIERDAVAKRRDRHRVDQDGHAIRGRPVLRSRVQQRGLPVSSFHPRERR